MFNLLILILVALIVFPVVIIFIRNIDLKTKLTFLIGGLLIALIGMLVQSSMSLYYSLLIMIGLIFAGAVLITKQLEKQKLAEVEMERNIPQTIKEGKETPIEAIPVVEPASPVDSTLQNAGEDWLTPQKKEEQ